MKLIGRIREQELLTDALTSHRSELVAIYGRRRIGKTYLVRAFFGKQITFSFTGLSKGKRSDQLKSFMLKLNEVSADFMLKKPRDWLEAFSYFKGITETHKKKVVFIDEFPWVDSHKSGFLPAFENFWNDYCTTRSDLLVVVCGSAAAYMVKNIINNSAGLSKRVAQLTKRHPFDLDETKEFLKFKGLLIEEEYISKMRLIMNEI